MPELSFLPVLVVLLLAAVCVVTIFRRMHLSPVLGYFVAGAAIGEHGWLKFVKSSDTEVFGELGVVFLLFAIGLELTFDRLKSMRVHVFGFGGLQLILTSVVIGTAVYFMHSHHFATAIVVGGGLALSSTAIVLQVLAERRQQSTQVGRLSLAVLLMQDFAVVPLLVSIPILASGNVNSIAGLMGMAFLKAVIVLLVIFVIGRKLLRPLFKLINVTHSKNNELFIATTLLIVLSAAWATEKMGLSLALGAFVAGLLVAETEYHIQAEESIAPFKGLLLGLFFMSVGMQFNMVLLIEKLNLIIGLSALLIFIKAAIIFGLCILFRFNKTNALHSGLMLAQGSEFAFILFNLATQNNIISSDLGQTLMIVVTITMALTPLLSMLGEIVSKSFDKREKMDYREIYKDIADLNGHVIIIGFGRVGKMVSRLLEAEKVNYISLDTNPNNVLHERKEGGVPIYLGDGSNVEILKSIATDRAKSVIITIDNASILKKCTKAVRDNWPKLPIIVRAKDLSTDQELIKLGASAIVPETYETGLQMGGAVLKSIGISEFEISRIKNQFRHGNYIMAQTSEIADLELIEKK